MSKEKLIDLDQEQLDLLHAILKQHIPNKTVWAYGSRVNWKAVETSDLDLTVFDCTPMDIYDLKEDLEESDLLISVDVMDWENIPESFREKIREKYVVVQGEVLNPEGWREVRLGEVVEVIGGGTPSTKIPEYWDGNIPWLAPPDFTNCNRWVKHTRKTITEAGLKNSSTKMLETSDLIISARGTVGALAQLKRPMAFSQTNYGLKANNQYTNNDFLFYVLKYSLNKFKRLSYGAVFDTITKATFNEITIVLPTLPEQKAIAEVLSSLDDKIDLLHRQNKTLEDMAQALFRQSFTGDESRQWDTGTLSDEFTVTMGQSPPGTSYNEKEQGIPLFQGNADFGFRFPKNRVYTTEPKRFAKKFDTLISVRAPVGEQNMAQESCCIGRGVASFRYKKNQEFYSYTYYKMKSLMKEIKRFDQEGTVFGSISKDDFEKLEIVLPPHNLIQTFQNNAQKIDEKICLNYSQARQLEKLRDILLPKLMIRKVRMKAHKRL